LKCFTIAGQKAFFYDRKRPLELKWQLTGNVSFEPADCHVSSEFPSSQIKTREGRSTMKIFQAKQQVSLLVGVCLVILIGCGGQPATPAPPTPMVGANSIVISTFTPASGAETIIPTLELTSNPSVIGRIPGLSPVNVTISLEGQQFTCTAVKKVGSYYERTCLKGLPSETLFQVIISGRESFIVDFIETAVRQAGNPDSKIASPLLGLIAALPYDGATPEDARAWVESTIPTLSAEAQEMTFGGVKYVLSGPPKALVLEIGELP
jgi:hypothetical protein